MEADGTRAGPRIGPVPVRAVLLDALGTLVGLQPPAPHLVAALAARGIAVSERRAHAAMAAEMAHYRAQHHRAGTPDGLAAVRAQCAQVLGDGLGAPAVGLDAGARLEVLLASLRFFAYPEVPGVLTSLRAAGLRLVVCSNWDLSLPEVLAATGLAGLVDGVVVSAVEGVAKPDPELMRRALRVAGDVDPAAAVHVGDSMAADVRGARAAGIRAVLVRRSGHEVRSEDPDRELAPGGHIIGDLGELRDLVLYPRGSR